MRTFVALAPLLCANLGALHGCAVGAPAPQTQAELAAGPPREPPAANGTPAPCAGEVATPACAADTTPHGPGDEWVEGYWHYNGTRYVWLPGRWQKRHPAYTWVPR